MEFRVDDQVDTDVLVVGGGGAAARAGLSASLAGATVRLAVKSRFLKGGSTATAFSELLSIAAATGDQDPRDEPLIHYQDTMNAGRGFVNPTLVRTLAEESPHRLRDLVNLGLQLDRQANGRLRQALSDFATYPRACRADGVTSRNMLRTLARHLSSRQVPIDEEVMIFRILTDDAGVSGALGIARRTGRVCYYRTRAVVLATGGAYHLYRHAVGTPEMTGDGYGLALGLGLPLVNMEFVQIGPAVIHPSVVLLSGPVWKTHPELCLASRRPLFQGALPEGITTDAVLDHKAFPFTSSNPSFYLDTAIQRAAELDPTAHGGVWCRFPADRAELMESRMPKTKRMLLSRGIDPFQDMEVGLVAQCMNGGVPMRSSDGETDLPGLFAVGEVAGGVRGPDRPGGNSLAEGQVFGHRAGTRAAETSRLSPRSVPAPRLGSGLEDLNRWLHRGRHAGAVLSQYTELLKHTMSTRCLVIRDADGLRQGQETLSALRESLSQGFSDLSPALAVHALSLQNMLMSAETILTAAGHRTESRSGHYREDFPERDDQRWLNSLAVHMSEPGVFRVHPWVWPDEEANP